MRCYNQHSSIYFKKPQLKLLLVALLPLLCNGNRGQADKTLYPIRNLQASLTASEGYGTVVATRTSYEEDNDCVLIVSYSPSDSNCNLTRSFWDSRSDEFDNGGDSSQDDHHIIDSNSKGRIGGSFMTPIAFRGAVGKSSTQKRHSLQKHQKIESKSLHIMHEKIGICLAMTGFASDVKHLVRYVASVISEYEYLYGGEVPSIHSIVRDSLASYLTDSSAGRPFGTQGLIVGNEYTQLKNGGKVKIYTLDPSGNFRHCIAGVAAIGRNSQSIQDSMFKALKKTRSNEESNVVPQSDLEASLDMVIRSILENMYEEEELFSTNEIMSVKFEAVVVHGRGQSKNIPYGCSIINQEFIHDACQRYMESLRSKLKFKS